MRSVKLSSVILACFGVALVAGCESELRDLRIQNGTQRNRLAQLESESQTTALQLDQCKRQLDAAQQKGGIEGETLQQKVKALEEDLARKKELIASMQQRLLAGGIQLPVELSTKLDDFAKSNPQMVEYDSGRGLVKFKSDLLFDKGSDQVASGAAETIKTLCQILNSKEAQAFDIIIAGHTDDIPILKPETKAKHPTNWYLSAHRAIAVLEVMANCGVAPKRMSARGFSEYRPIEDNKPNRAGNAKNRRVEIYIVPEGV